MGKKGDHRGNVGQGSTDVFARQAVAARNNQAHGSVAQNDKGVAAKARGPLWADLPQDPESWRTHRVSPGTGTGYSGGYTRVTDFIRDSRSTQGKVSHAFVPLKFGLGEAFQFDWSE